MEEIDKGEMVATNERLLGKQSLVSFEFTFELRLELFNLFGVNLTALSEQSATDTMAGQDEQSDLHSDV